MSNQTRTNSGATSYQLLRMGARGIIAKKTVYNAGGYTLSASDCYQMMPVVHGMSIVDGYLKGTAPVSGTVVIRVENDDYTFVTATISATAALTRFTGGVCAISLSDSETYDTIDCTVVSASTATVTCSFELVVFYVHPGQI